MPATYGRFDIPKWYNYYTIMGFKFDPQKSVSNVEKHGIDFETAQELWADPNRVEFTARFKDEERHGLVAIHEQRLWCAIFTLRGANIRIISVRGREHMKRISTMTAHEFDERFDQGEDISTFVDASTIRRPGLNARRVNVDFPEWMIQNLDRESKLIGVSRQALIKLWIAERIQAERRARA